MLASLLAHLLISRYGKLPRQIISWLLSLLNFGRKRKRQSYVRTENNWWKIILTVQHHKSQEAPS